LIKLDFLNHHPRLKWKLYHIYRFFHDSTNFIRKNSQELNPTGLLFIGGGNFKEVGEEFLNYFQNLCGIKSSDKILDIGCGSGRMAIPLTKFLDSSGVYEGFDIFSSGITWCQKNINPKYSNFHFLLADIYNKEYNPNGKINSSQYKFPYESNYFDFIFATSVFTHMLPEDVDNYFSEIKRVMKKNGKCLLTFLLLNADSLESIYEKKSKITFEQNEEKFSLVYKDLPEHTIAFKESFVRSIYEKYGMKIKEPIQYGSWSGRDDFLSFQDLIISFNSK